MNFSQLFPYKQITLSDGAVSRRYYKFRSTYRDLIAPRLAQMPSEFEVLLYSIMIYEDYNRPSTVRFFERVILRLLNFFKQKRQMTLGVMQVSTCSIISDIDSVKIAVERLYDHIKIFQQLGTSNEEIIYCFIHNYNPSQLYKFEISKLSGIIKRELTKPKITTS